MNQTQVEEVQKAIETLDGAGLEFRQEVTLRVWVEGLEEQPAWAIRQAAAGLAKTATRYPSLSVFRDRVKLAARQKSSKTLVRGAVRECPLCSGSGFMDILTEKYPWGNTVQHCPCKLGEDTRRGMRLTAVRLPSGNQREVVMDDEVRRVCAEKGYKIMQPAGE